MAEGADIPQIEDDRREVLKRNYRKWVKMMVPYDPRFPNQNQTRNCEYNYVDYYRCLKAKDGDEEYCAWYKHVYKNLCPQDWVEKWEEWREKGIHPVLDINP